MLRDSTKYNETNKLPHYPLLSLKQHWKSIVLLTMDKSFLFSLSASPGLARVFLLHDLFSYYLSEA